MACAHLRRLGLALGLLAVGRPARGHMPESFHLFVPVPKRRPQELKTVRNVALQFTPRGALPLREDGHLDQAAETLLTWVETHEDIPLPQNLARAHVLASGATEPAIALFAVRTQKETEILGALADAHDRAPLNFTPTHFGFAARDGRAVFFVSRRLIELAPVPRCARPQDSVVLAGRISGLVNKLLILGVQNSDGHIVRRTFDGVEETFRLTLQGPHDRGPLNLELMGDAGQGLEIFNHFSVAPCVPHKNLKSEALRAPEVSVGVGHESRVAAQDTLRAEIQGLRARARARPLKTSEALDRLAFAHARNMCRNHRFAHRDAAGRDAQQRLQKAGIAFRWVFENLAVSHTYQGALSQWKESPLHLQNLLDKRADTLGIGIVRGTNPDSLWVVVLLIEAA